MSTEILALKNIKLLLLMVPIPNKIGANFPKNQSLVTKLFWPPLSILRKLVVK